jgi:hypothetical protein
MLAAIFGVLRHYNSTDVALWSHSWSLNSLVGLLATISQISMAVPLTSGISQFKWVWYKDRIWTRSIRVAEVLWALPNYSSHDPSSKIDTIRI